MKTISIFDISIICIWFFIIITLTQSACSNPYVNPNTSKALSEEKQLEELKAENKLLQQQNQILIGQNILLERIALAIENK